MIEWDEPIYYGDEADEWVNQTIRMNESDVITLMRGTHKGVYPETMEGNKMALDDFITVHWANQK